MACALALVVYVGVCAADKALSAGTTMMLTLASPAAPVPTPAPPSGTIDLNTAGMDALLSLPGIGDHLAREIILARERCPFTYLEDLDTIPGIGERRIEALRPLVCVIPVP